MVSLDASGLMASVLCSPIGLEIDGLLEGSAMTLQMGEDVLQEVQRGSLGILEREGDESGSAPGEDSRELVERQPQALAEPFLLLGEGIGYP